MDVPASCRGEQRSEYLFAGTQPLNPYPVRRGKNIGLSTHLGLGFGIILLDINSENAGIAGMSHLGRQRPPTPLRHFRIEIKAQQPFDLAKLPNNWAVQ